MATGHILPGYGNVVTKYRRAKSAGYPLDSNRILRSPNSYKLNAIDFQTIKNQAKDLWHICGHEDTTYNSFYQGFAPNDPKALGRPASPTRRNNPHPPQVFLSNRLHFIPGYQNADATLGKPVYRVDASVAPDEQQIRREPRNKYVARPTTALLNQYKEKENLKELYDNPEEKQAAEAFLRVADDKDKLGVVPAIERWRYDKVDQSELEPDFNLPPGRPKTAIPSVHRWMKFAGGRELADLRNSEPDPDYSIERLPNLYMPRHIPIAYSGPMRMEDIEKTGRYRVDPKKRGEFLLHPEWPPSMPHHRLP